MSTTTTDALVDQPDDDGTELAEDDVYHLLQVERRRAALRYLGEHDGTVRMRDLAEQVAAWENDTTVEALSSKERQRVYISLYQRHLPKLDEYGVIEYEQDRGIVERTDRADRLDPYLGHHDSEIDRDDGDDGGVRADDATGGIDDDEPGEEAPDRDGGNPYLASLGVCGAALGTVALGLEPFSTLSGLAVGVLTAFLFGLVALGRMLRESVRRSGRPDASEARYGNGS